MNFPNFSEDELRCKGSGKLQLAPGFGQALQGLRDALGESMTVTSACRSLNHNRAVGGHPKSLHICDFPPRNTGGCCSVDVAAVEGERDDYRAKLAEIAWARGWSIGFHPRFLHLDLRTQYAGLPQTRFTY